MPMHIKDEGSLKTPVKVIAKKGAKKVDGDAPVFTLPTKKSTPVALLIGYIMLIFGEKKIGKTSMLAESGDRTFFAFFEPGGKALSTWNHVFPKWSHFKMAVRQIIDSKRFDHVVIDTVDLAYKSASKSALAKLGIDHEGDVGFGKGWAAVRDEFEAPIMQLVNAGVAVTFVSHAMEAEVTTRDGSKYDKLVATMPKQARAMVEGLVDIWGYFGYDGRDRVLIIQGDDHISAGHRLSRNFRTPDGTPIRQIHMGNDPTEAWQNFNAAFNNKYTPPPTKKREEETETAPKKIFKKLKTGGK